VAAAESRVDQGSSGLLDSLGFAVLLLIEVLAWT
jgi:hypothetical protein